MGKKPQSLIFFLLAIVLFAGFVAYPAFALGTESLITTRMPDPKPVNPSTWGNYVVLEDQQEGNNTIVLYDLTNGEEQTISSLSAHAHSPRIQGDNVVWYENNGAGSDIYVYNLVSMVVTRITDSPVEKLNPAIFGTKIIWQEYLDTDGTYPYYDLQEYDLASPGQITNITPHGGTPGTDSGSHETPSIWGDDVVWLDWDDTRLTYEIFTNNTVTGPLTQVSDDGAGSLKYHPVIYGNTILWSDYRTGDADIFSDTVTPTGNIDLTPYSSSTQDFPALYGDSAVWLDDRDHEGAYYQIGQKNLTTSVETYPVTPSSRIPLSAGNSPSVYDNRIVWQDDRDVGGNGDIYLYTDGVSVTCPVAGFTQDITSGNPGLSVQFSDTSTPPPSHWSWDFGDGSTAISQNPAHVYTPAGVFPVTLTVGTPYCRSTTAISNSHNVSVGSAPLVDFSGSPREGMAPLPVTFSETSSGSPAAWNWSFGDGEFSESENPSHTYTTGGRYAVRLNATNAYGTGSLSKPGYITVTAGAHEIAFTNITGIRVQPAPSHQYLVYDKSSLPLFALSPDRSQLLSHPPPDFGWQSVIFSSNDGFGFVQDTTSVQGNLSRISLKTRDITPTGFSTGVGNNVQVNYRMNLTSYRYPGWLITDMWEGTTPSDQNNFQIIYTRANFASMNAAYTINTTRVNLTVPEGAVINVSVRTDWLAGSEGLDWGRQHAFIIATGYGSDGNLNGVIFPTRYLFNDTSQHLEYFESDIPAQYAYFNKFALAKLSGSGNPFQLITLSVASHVSPPSAPNDDNSGQSGTGAGAGAGTAIAPEAVQNVNPPKAPEPADPGRTEKIYANAQGVITQATLLPSTDQRVQLSLPPGVMAKDRTGAPLSSVTVRAVPVGSLPAVPSSSTYLIAGMAYIFEPDGATFSPDVTLSFSYPQATWSEEYWVKTFDPQSGTWVDLPTIHDPDTGLITAQVSHFSTIALFAKSPPASSDAAPKATPQPALSPVPLATQALPPGTALNIFVGMMTWIADLVIKNVYLFVIVILAVLGIAYMVKKRRSPGSGM